MNHLSDPRLLQALALIALILAALALVIVRNRRRRREELRSMRMHFRESDRES